MTNPTLAEDILYATSCVQDYLDTIDPVEEQERYNRIVLRIERLMQFYYQLVGFNPAEEK